MLLCSLGSSPSLGGERPVDRPTFFRESGLTLLRSGANTPHEVWCRCDAGPIGFLSTAAHGHADALSVEVRHGGTDILADPGTFCYQYQTRWREYFRSTSAHNTLEIDGVAQAKSMGPFIWTHPVEARTVDVSVDPDCDRSSWIGSYHAKGHGGEVITHTRRVQVEGYEVTISDQISKPASVTLRFHLGADVTCSLSESTAKLIWDSDDAGSDGVLELPPELEWSMKRGQEDPLMGWYSAKFDVKVPANTLEGVGEASPDQALVSRLVFVS